MAGDGLQAELALALRGRADSFARALAVAQRLEDARGKPVVVKLVTDGPPAGGGATWGECFAAALGSGARDAARDAHGAALLAFERAGGYWSLLEALSDARVLEPGARQAFYAQFGDARLHAALLAALDAHGPADAVIRRCVRNLSRSPGLRVPLQPALPLLARDLAGEEGGPPRESAAALCNLACHGENKERAVACGAVGHLVRRLGRGPLAAEVAEDFVACLGVLTGGCEAGVAALFEAAAAEGRERVFGPIFALLRAGDGAAQLQCLVLDVVGGLFAASPQFKAWAVSETALVGADLPRLLRADAAGPRKSALELAITLLEVDAFRDTFQRADGVGALQSVLERARPRTGGAGAFMCTPVSSSQSWSDRREPTESQLAQFLLSKILII